MTATARPDADIEVRSAICMRHQTDSQEMHFCFDCSRMFCAHCQLAEDNCCCHNTDLKSHRTIKLKELLHIRKERIAQLRTQLLQYSIKHETSTNEANKLEAEKNRQIQVLDDVIDQFAEKLHQKVEDLKVSAKQLIQNRARLQWEKSPATSIQQAAVESLSNIHKVRSSLEYEIQHAETDELTMATRSKEMDALGVHLAAFLQSQIQLPEPSAFDLAALRTQLQASIAQMGGEVSRSIEEFTRSLDYRESFPNPESVRLVKQQKFHLRDLVLPSDQNQNPNINNVAHEEDTDIIYFTDEHNASKIKALNLKTRQITGVYSRPSNVVLYGLFAQSDRPNRSLILTTEQKISTPVATIRVNFLRRNASGQLSLVQTLTLQESSTNPWATFASAPNGGVFCAIWGSTSVHEMSRSLGNAGKPFADASTAHRLPATVYYVCGLQCAGEQRLVASFADRSVRVFRSAAAATAGSLADGALSVVQRITAPDADWSPNTLVGLSDGGICIRSNFTDPADPTPKFSLELCTADASGTLSFPRRLAQFTNHVEVWSHLCAKDAADSAHRIVVAEYSNCTTVALRVLLFQTD